LSLALILTLPQIAGAKPAAVKAATPVPLYLQGLESKMFDPAVDARGRQSLKEKITMYKLSVSQQEAGLAAPAGKDPSTVQFPEGGDISAQPQVLPAGIYPGSDGLIKPQEGNIRNYFQQQTEDGSVLVLFAGGSPEDDSQGLIIWMGLDAALEVVEYRHYLHEAKVGAFTILEASGERLTLLADNQTTWYFDLSTQTFTQVSLYPELTRP
jgi:hypothetical protein